MKHNRILPIQYDEIKPSSHEIFAVKKVGKWGYINKHQETLWHFVFDDAWSFDNNKAQVRLANKYGYLERFHSKSCIPRDVLRLVL